MSIARALAVLGAGASGYQAGQEDLRRRKREDEGDEWTKKQRARQEQKWSREDELAARQDAQHAEEEADRQAMRREAKPLAVEPDGQLPTALGGGELGVADGVPALGFRVGQGPGAKRFASQAEAEAAAAQANTMPATMRRVASSVADPMRRLQLEQQAQAAEVGGMQLDRAREERAQELWRRNALGAVVGAPGKPATPESIAKWMTESKADGMDGASKWASRTDGKTVTIYPVGPDGKATGNGFNFADDSEGRLRFVSQLDTHTPVAAKLADIRADKKLASDLANLEADNRRQDAAQAATEKYQQGMLKHQSRMADIAAGRSAAAAAGRAPQPQPIWDEKADQRLFDHFKTEDPTTGAKAYDGDGVAFAKQIGVAAAQRFNGDTLRAVGFAIEADNQLKAKALQAATSSGGKISPADALRGLRQQALASLTAPPPQPQKPLSSSAQAMSVAPPGSVTLDPASGRYLPTRPALMSEAIDPLAPTYAAP